MYFHRKEHACVYLDGFVYAIGGYIIFYIFYIDMMDQLNKCYLVVKDIVLHKMNGKWLNH